MRSILAERSAALASEVRFFATGRSAGTLLSFGDGVVEVEDVAASSFSGLDIALFAMGAPASREYAPRVAEAGAVVVDNSSAWRMDPEVPLVVPEVNRAELRRVPKGIVGNPNCTTIVCMSALAALRDAAGLRRVVASTYQAVSGAGRAGVAELSSQMAKAADASALTFDGAALDVGPATVFPEPVAYNVVPMAGKLVDDETDEEHKFRNESRKILSLPDLAVSCTCVRVPVYTGHAVSLNVELERPLSTAEARAVLGAAEGVALADVPTPRASAGRDDCYVGRVRVDDTVPAGLSLFVAGDNLRKGAALNAVQIAEELQGRPA